MPVEKYVFEFGNIMAYDDYLVLNLNEGILFDSAKCWEMIEKTKHLYLEKPFGIISFRENSYAVDPMIYTKLAKIENLVGLAIVSEQDIARKNAEEIEKQFFRKTDAFEVFTNMEDAIKWITPKIQSQVDH